MEDMPQPPPLIRDIHFEIRDSGYEIWFSDRISNDHPNLVDECADWLEDQVGVVNLGQIDHKALLADGVLTDGLKSALLAWWKSRFSDLDVD